MTINRQTAIWLGLLLLLVTAVYWNHFDNAFQFDDSHTIVSNQFITDPGNIPLFFTDGTTGSSLPTNQDYRPVVATMNAVDYWIAGGLDTRVFHWHIFAEFLVIIVLVYLLAGHLFQAATGRKCPVAALLAAALFGLHTATAETINYIIARSDVFSTLMVLAAFMVFVSSDGKRRHWALLPFVIGCLTKPTTLMLAPILLVYSALIERPSLLVSTEQPAIRAAIWRALSRTWLYFVIGALMFGFTQLMTPPTATPGGNYSGLEYLNTQAWVMWVYVRTFILPTGLTADTDMEIIREYFAPPVLWGIAMIALMLVITWLASLRRSTLPIAFGILWFFIALVPTSSVIPLAEVMNHHRTFFAYIGLVISGVWAAWLGFQWLGRAWPQAGWNHIGAVLAVVVLAAHGWGTWQRNEVWHSNESLWHDVTIKSPLNGRGLMNYGLALMARGDIEGAIEHFTRALDTSYGNHSYLYINLGIATNVLARRSNSPELLEQAENYFRDGVRRGPGLPQSHYRLAAWLHEQGRSEEALQSVNTAVALSPGSKDALALQNTLVLETADSLDQAIELAQSINTPDNFVNLSLRLYQAGRYEDAITAANDALALQPQNSYAWNNICSAQNQLGRFDEAINACEKAIEIDPDFQLARNNLAWALQEKDKQR